MRDLHVRLSELGNAPVTDALDVYGDETVALVEAFQRAKGLVITGEVDEVTWSRLVEAGWRLGQRLLYLSRPNLRGDDVAELQVRLAQLGFDPGRIDGIFGPLLEEALSDFQRNCAIEVNGTLTRGTLFELSRVSSTASRNLVNEARDVAGFNEGTTGPLILSGNSPMLEVLARALEETFEVRRVEDTSVNDVAAFANDSGASLVLSIDQMDTIDGVHLHYWASYRSYSRRGEKLASAIAAALARRDLSSRVELTGMALPILRETRMTTLRVEHGVFDENHLRALATVICSTVVEVIHR